MWILIALLILGDVALAAWLLLEKHNHRLTRNALHYWRNRHAATLDATSRLRDVRGQNGVRDVRVRAPKGDAA